MRLFLLWPSFRLSIGARAFKEGQLHPRQLGDRYPPLRAAIAGDALSAAAVEVRSGAPDIALSQVTLLPPITDPDKIICAARNYRAHAGGAFRPRPRWAAERRGALRDATAGQGICAIAGSRRTTWPI